MSLLILNAACMSLMSDEHLITSLYAQAGPLTSTPAEMELLRRLEAALDKIDSRPTEEQMAKKYESRLEQSEFRAQLIEEIIELCDKPGSKKDLVAAIKMALENSYVEL